MVMGIANLAMVTGNLGRPGVGVNPLRGQNNVQGACDMGSFPHELPGYRHVSDPAVRALFGAAWGVDIDSEPGLRIPNMFDAAIDGSFKGLYVQGEDIAQSDPNTHHVTAALESLECLVVQDLFINETAKFAHVFLPGSSFLEKDGTFTNAERRISRVRKVTPPLAGKADWETTLALAEALGYPMRYDHPSQIMDEIARLTPTFTGVSYEKIDRLGSIQWPCNDRAPEGTPVMHIGEFVRGKGKFVVTEYVATSERSNWEFPLILTTGRILSQYNVGAQTRRTANNTWHRRTGSRSTRTTPNSAGSRTASGARSAAAPARPCCARPSPSASSRASSTRPSTSRARAPTSSPPRTPTGRPTAPSTRSRRCR
jgi:formate dehydrogenase major subunit